MSDVGKRAPTAVLVAFAILVACWSMPMTGQNFRAVRIVIDDSVIDKADPWVIVKPMWWSVSIYDGPIIYERDLKRFSRPQRYLFAIMWYDAEVNNGGHHQFYSNSTGIVWRDALKGHEEIGAHEGAEIIRASAALLGGSPSLNHEARIKQLEKVGRGAFDTIDERYYNQKPDDGLTRYIKAHRSSFYFDGIIRKP